MLACADRLNRPCACLLLIICLHSLAISSSPTIDIRLCHCAQISKECVDLLLEQVPDDDRTEYIAAFGVRGRDTTPATRVALRQACAKLCRQIVETVKAQIADAPASK